MHTSFFSKAWRQRWLVLVFTMISLCSGWILQDALFSRYPFLGSKLGPVLQWVVPDFYYRLLNKTVKAGEENYLYYFCDQAMEESPAKYKKNPELHGCLVYFDYCQTGSG